MVKTAALVTVRNSSTRLPDKAVKKVCADKTAIDVVIERAKLTGLEVVVCTSVDDSDSVFEEIAENNSVSVFRGALYNKINRWYYCFQKYNLDYALLVDGDDLLYDYQIGIRAIDKLIASDSDLVKNPHDIVCGFFTYAISRAGINSLFNVAKKYPDTDVITNFIKKADLKVTEVDLMDWEKNDELRLTLDYEEDLEMFRKTFELIDYHSTGKEITEFYYKNPGISKINIHRQKDFINNQDSFNSKIN